MPPVADRQLLLELNERLTAALAKQDWQAMAAIDQAIRTCLQALAGRESPGDEVQSAKQQLQQSHERARVACAEECERLRQLLLAHLEYAEGRSAYMRVDMFRGGR